ncbi:MAG: type VI secretion system contractile sheath large subunit [Planctomycetales bacterium]|nr:type VI secretion system contractile sheath large subunit [Planctomycetales bacterium]
MSSDPSSFDSVPVLRDSTSTADGPDDLPRSAPQEQPTLLQSLLERIPHSDARNTPSRLQWFHDSTSVSESLEHWLGCKVQVVDNQLSIAGQMWDKDKLVRRLNRDVAIIDDLVSQQLNVILHHSQFQRLEATWRGVEYLTKQVESAGDQLIKIRILNMTWSELERDFERAVEFDQSQLFQKVYEQEFGMPGGEPFGTIIADYTIQPQPTREHPHDDITILKELAKVGAAAFCPILTNANPAMFGVNAFDELEHTVDHAKTFSQTVYTRWRSLRDMEEARFLGIVLPKILMRLPYEDDGSRIDRFQFQEDVHGPDHSKYLWGGAAFAMGEVLIRAFAQAGWLADIRGIQRDVEQGGIVVNLPTHSFATDKLGIANKFSTDVVVTDTLEKQLADLGFMSLCHCKDTTFSAFYSNNSIQKPKVYDRDVATMNARISSMLQYMYCVSRFAQYVKVLGREKTGSFSDPQEFEDYLQRWIVRYVTADTEARPDVKAKFPLREASVKVHQIPGKPGVFNCVMHLAPHYELDELAASVRLVAELTPSTNQ